MAALPAGKNCENLPFDAKLYIDYEGFLMSDFIRDTGIDYLTIEDLKYLIEIMLDS